MNLSVNQDPWSVAEHDFPAGSSPAVQLRFALNYAVRAPSLFNVQPWLFRIRGSEVELYLDRSRQLPVTDPDSRELVISCGIALFYLRVALQYFGYELKVSILPSWDDPELLARVELRQGKTREPEIGRLFAAMVTARPYYRAFKPSVIPVRLLARLRRDAAQEGGRLHFPRSKTRRKKLATLVATAERIQESDPLFVNEMDTWINPSGSRGNDGIPGLPPGSKDRFVVRTFDDGDGYAAHGRGIDRGTGVFGVLGSDANRVPDWLAAGQAMGRVLLRLHSEGLSASFLNQPIEFAEFRRDVAQVTGLANPQCIIRIGYGSEVEPQPRRPVEEVLTTPVFRCAR